MDQIVERKQQLEAKITILKGEIGICDGRIAVHPKSQDDPKKGKWCYNRKTRLHHQWQRFYLVKDLSLIEAQLRQLLGEDGQSSSPTGDAPIPAAPDAGLVEPTS